MARKHKCPPTGAPDWVLTYGDMMSLLLTFFILLAALSELKKEEQFHAIVTEVQKNFGMHGVGDEMEAMSLIQRLQYQAERQQEKVRNTAATDDPGMEGKQMTVTRVREGMKFVIGGRVTFEPWSATLDEADQAALRRVAEQVRGYNNKIELRGHASPMETPGTGAPYPDLWTLSYARAKAVMDYLTSAAVGIRPDRLRLVACGDCEPLLQRVYSQEEQAPNRRVEIIVTEGLVEDFTKPEGSP